MFIERSFEFPQEAVLEKGLSERIGHCDGSSNGSRLLSAFIHFNQITSSHKVFLHSYKYMSNFDAGTSVDAFVIESGIYNCGGGSLSKKENCTRTTMVEVQNTNRYTHAFVVHCFLADTNRSR